MKTFIVLSVALCCLALSVDALFWPVAATSGAAAVTVSGGSALAGASLLGGLVVLKGLALGTLLLASRNGGSSRGSRRYRYRGRGKREAEEIEIDEDDLAFAYIAETEPEQCYHRLICELATGAMPSSDNDVILSLFNKETPAGSPKYEYHVAALLGKQMRNMKSCEVRYTCPLSSQQIEKLFA